MAEQKRVTRSRLAEDRQVELLTLPEPDDVLRMIGEILAGVGMREDG